MHETGKKLLNLMFRPGETVCVSYNKYGYHSIPLDSAMSGNATLVPTADSLAKRKLTLEEGIEKVPTERLLLCALNPIKGYREDQNCTSFRNFLIEMDYGPIPEQMEYIRRIDMPYSAAIFSGNKSIHFLISLDKDLPSENVYRVFSEWTLGIVALADQQTKNPSRSIRIPGAFREPGKQQQLMDFRGPVKTEDLITWLKRYPDSKPKEKQRVERSEVPDFARVRGWVCKALVKGIIPPNRNRQWFAVGVEFALAGYEEDATLEILRSYFSPDRDFKEREWETTIKSAFKWTYERK